MRDKYKIQIIIPAHNPDERLTALISSLPAEFEFTVVDDGSDSLDSKLVLNSLPESVRVLRHGVNMGKGAALKTALKRLINDGADYDGVIFVDCDGKHRPGDILKIADRLENSEYEFIKGRRTFNKTVPAIIRLGNKITKRVFYTRTRVKIDDTQSGLRGFKKRLVPIISEIAGKRYEYELNVLLWAAENDIAIEEVDIFVDYRGRRALRHFHVLRDSVLIYSRLLKFTAISFTAFLIDYFMVLLLSELTRKIPHFISLLICVAGARVVSGGFAFIANRSIVFKSSKNNSDESFARMPALKFAALTCFLLAMSYLLLIFFTELIGMFMLRPLWIAKPLVDCILFIFNYHIQNTVIFKKRKGTGLK